MPWHSTVGDVVFDGGLERLFGVGDMVDVIHPHPSTRGGVVVAMWWMWGLSKGGDMAWLASISIGNEHALA